MRQVSLGEQALIVALVVPKEQQARERCRERTVCVAPLQYHLPTASARKSHGLRTIYIFKKAIHFFVHRIGSLVYFCEINNASASTRHSLDTDSQLQTLTCCKCICLVINRRSCCYSFLNFMTKYYPQLR